MLHSRSVSPAPTVRKWADDSQVLRMNLSNATRLSIIRALRAECPSLSMYDSMYMATLLGKVYNAGVLRGKVVNNA